jgi:tetratricopeptide (TPR) repeat protein
MVRSLQARRAIEEALVACGAQLSKEKQQNCEQLLLEYVKANPDPHMNSIRFAAASAELVGLDNTACKLLQQALTEAPKQQVMPGKQPPIEVHLNVWLGRLLRDSGDYKGALAAYQRAADLCNDDTQARLRVLSLLYATEIQTSLLKDANGAQASLRKAQEAAARISKDFAPEIYSAWVARLSEEASGKTPTIVCPYNDLFEALIYEPAMLNGIISEGSPNVTTGSPLWTLNVENMKRCIESTKSRIDRQSAQVVLLKYDRDQAEMPKAEILMKDLFSSSEFFAPIGGIHLAQLQHEQGKLDEAKATLQTLSKLSPDTGWPQYAARVEGMLLNAPAAPPNFQGAPKPSQGGICPP